MIIIASKLIKLVLDIVVFTMFGILLRYFVIKKVEKLDEDDLTLSK